MLLMHKKFNYTLPQKNGQAFYIVYEQLEIKLTRVYYCKFNVNPSHKKLNVCQVFSFTKIIIVSEREKMFEVLKSRYIIMFREKELYLEQQHS